MFLSSQASWDFFSLCLRNLTKAWASFSPFLASSNLNVFSPTKTEMAQRHWISTWCVCVCVYYYTFCHQLISPMSFQSHFILNGVHITGSDILLGLGCIKGRRICAGSGLWGPPPTPGTALRDRNASPSKSSLLKVSWSSTVTSRHAPGDWHFSNVTELFPQEDRSHITTIN